MADNRHQFGSGADDERGPVPPPRPAVWSGRAEVRRPVGSQYQRVGYDDEWADENDQPDRPWWMPILVAVVILLAVTLVGIVAWLVVANDREPVGVPSPSAHTAPATAVSSATFRATATTPVGPSASPTDAAVPMPPVVGLPLRAARDVLDELGIPYRLRYLASDQPIGMVIETDPPAGTPVAEEERVTLVIAVRAPGRPTATVPTRSATPPT